MIPFVFISQAAIFTFILYISNDWTTDAIALVGITIVSVGAIIFGLLLDIRNLLVRDLVRHIRDDAE